MTPITGTRELSRCTGGHEMMGDWFSCCGSPDGCCPNPQGKGSTVLADRDSGPDNDRTPRGRSPRGPPSQLAGVGIIFRLQSKLTEGAGLIVDEVVKGSPTDRQGQIKPEFRLVSIDEQDVRGMTPRQIAPLILGSPGSDVALSFIDPNEGSGAPVRTFEVRRGWTMK
mmetsp:Transcript_93368/g.150727  ORF Transcript_93368/g.150727 Transcript_93368/m.150727 type:complete len:168 (-) Transcript_93368:475-978(-)